MADSFQHVLLTRFNVRIFGSRGLDPAWLAHRFRFFERICFPSVMTQSATDFRWILFCDTTTPDWALARLRALIAADRRVEPVLIDGPDTPEVLQAAITSGLPPEATHLVTSRLDNDDGLARRFMETVQEQFAGQEYEFVNFPEGHTCFQGRVYGWRHPSSPFLSLVERLTGPDRGCRTVMCEPHQEVAARCPVRQVECGPAWLQVIHGQNAWNMVRGADRPLADLDPHHAPEVIAAVADAAGTWGRRETLAYWARRIRKKFLRLPAA